MDERAEGKAIARKKDKETEGGRIEGETTARRENNLKTEGGRTKGEAIARGGKDIETRRRNRNDNKKIKKQKEKEQKRQNKTSNRRRRRWLSDSRRNRSRKKIKNVHKLGKDSCWKMARKARIEQAEERHPARLETERLYGIEEAKIEKIIITR